MSKMRNIILNICSSNNLHAAVHLYTALSLLQPHNKGVTWSHLLYAEGWISAYMQSLMQHTMITAFDSLHSIQEHNTAVGHI
jgi:hypothetical protein